MALVACTAPRPPAPAAAPSPVASAPLRLTLIALNDFHGQLSTPPGVTPVPSTDAPDTRVSIPTGGVASLAAVVSQLRVQNPLTAVVAAGDLIGASPLTSALFHDEPTIEALNLAGLEFSAVGNHELDDGLAELLRMQNGGCASDAPQASCHRQRFSGARFKYLAANITEADTGRLPFPAHAFKTFDLGQGRTLKVGFIGAVLRGVPAVVVPASIRNLEFGDEADTINAAVPELRAAGADVIVVLIHEGGLTSQTTFDDTTCPDFSGDILPIVDRLDPAIAVIVSGHTHRTYICRRNGRLVTSAGSQGRFVTEIELILDPTSRRVLSSSAKQIAVTNRLPSSVTSAEVQDLVDAYTMAAAPLTQRVVASIREDITRRESADGESALGNLVADAHLAAMSALDAGGGQIAVMNSSGIRADLLADNGRVTYGDIHAVHPFANSLITLTLSGTQLHALLEQQWLRGDSVLQISAGFRYEWRASGAPGARVDIASMRLNGRPIDPTGKYRIVTNEFLANGGSGYTVLTEGTDRTRGILDSEALEKYLAAHSPLSRPAGGRIQRVAR
jgi:5'-nucleotidase